MDSSEATFGVGLPAQHDAAGRDLRLRKERRELLEWFRRQAAPLAGTYEGALRMLGDTGYPGRLHFIGHAVRDIIDRLVFVLDPQLPSNRVQYENVLDEVEKMWPPLSSASPDFDERVESATFPIPIRAAKRLNTLIQDHRERRRRPSNFELLLGRLMRSQPTRAGRNQRLIDELRAVHKWFRERAHLRRDNSAVVDESQLQSHFATFERILHSFVGDFFTGKEALDAILEDTNS